MNARRSAAALLVIAIIFLGIWTWLRYRPEPAKPPATIDTGATESVSSKIEEAPKDSQDEAKMPPQPEEKEEDEADCFAWVSGKIVSKQDGRRINNAGVSVHVPRDANNLQAKKFNFNTTGTDAQGLFSISLPLPLPYVSRESVNLLPDSLTFSLSVRATGHEDYDLGLTAPLLIARGQKMAGLVIELEPVEDNKKNRAESSIAPKSPSYFYGRLSGKIVSKKDSSAIANASVDLDLLENEKYLDSIPGSSNNVNFVINVYRKYLQEDDQVADSINCKLIVRAPGYLTAVDGEYKPVLLSRGHELAGLVIALQPEGTNAAGGHLAGTVFYADGSRRKYCPVELRLDPAGKISKEYTHADKDGHFKFTNLNAGVYWLHVHTQPLINRKTLSKRVDIIAGQTVSVDCTLQMPGQLQVELIDEAGQPYLAGCTMNFYDSAGVQSHGISAGSSLNTLKMDEGPTDILFMGTDGCWAVLSVNMSPGKDKQSTVVMKKNESNTVKITGTVVRSYDLVAIENAIIRLYPDEAEDKRHNFFFPAVKTDAGGNFTLIFPTEACSRKNVIEAHHQDYCDYSAALIMEPEGPPPPLKIRMQYGATLQVQISDRNGRPWPGPDSPGETPYSMLLGRLEARTGDALARHHANIWRSIPIRKDDLKKSGGIITLTHEKPGSVCIVLEKTENRRPKREKEISAELKDNSTTAVSIRMPE
jgi:hypothetical protein